jgi:hypothetical protein
VMPAEDRRVLYLAETLSPITHMSGSSGNESLIAREHVVTPRGVAQVPMLSGNALRHRLVRGPGMRWLVGEYGLAGTLTLPQLNFLFHGGSLTEGGGREDTARIADFQRTWPLGRLVGGCLPDQILAGSLQVWRGTLVCEENRTYLEAIGLGGALPEKRLRPAESFLAGYQYTRGDARKVGGEPAPRDAGTDGSDTSNLMIYSGQAVCRGAVFVGGFSLPHTSEVELGALLWSLRLWLAGGGTVGGQAARGHGRMALTLDMPEADQDATAGAYLEYARGVRDEAVAWLHGVFAPRAEKAAARGKGGRKGKAGPGPAIEESGGLLGESADG